MPTPERRIRKLNLNAPNDILARRGAILVEDAFRTASLPDPRGRLLVIRRLSLGPIRSKRGSAAIALAIEDRLRLLASTALYAGDPSADRHDIVYFQNEAEPFILLAARLARGQDTNAWFWPLVVRCFTPGMPRDAALRAMLCESATSANAALLVEIVRTLVEQDAADRLLGELSSEDGPQLLRAIGCSIAEASFELNARFNESRESISHQWSGVVARWISRWGADDARSLWLAAVTLLGGQPARALDPHLGFRAQLLIKRVTTESMPPDPPAQETQVTVQETARSQIRADDFDLRATGALGIPSSMRARNEELHDVGSSVTSQVDLNSGLAADQNVRSEAVSAHLPASIFTCHAGIFFLLPMMSRLGMSTMLQDNPHLIDSDVPLRLLIHLSLRLRIGVEDAMLNALAAMHTRVPVAPSGFVQPAIWKGICNPGPLTIRSVEGSLRERVLFDGSGRLALAWWRDKVPEAVRRLAGDLPVLRGMSLERRDGHDLLLDSWLTAMRRWSRRYARIGLHDLICRPGRISITNTHIDAVFDHRVADVRVRKAGLDLNPGWIPWLGRVVSFHYQYGDCVDG